MPTAGPPLRSATPRPSSATSAPWRSATTPCGGRGPLAARAACDLADTATAAELLALLDGYRPGELAPMQRAERDLARARLTATDGGPATGAAFTAAIVGLRENSTPYHLAHGLLDHAEHLLRTGDDQAAEAASAEARDIAARLRCQPLLDRAETIQPISPRAAAS